MSLIQGVVVRVAADDGTYSQNITVLIKQDQLPDIPQKNWKKRLLTW